MFTKNEIIELDKYLLSTNFPKPSGTLSGHAIGEPIEKGIYNYLKNKAPGSYFKQYELLNNMYLKHPNEDRLSLFRNEALRLLLNRGKKATEEWSPQNMFVEKQNDTADIVKIINKHDFLTYGILDIKTFNTKLKGQPPNIISAYKLAQLCMMILKNPSIESSFEIFYYSIDWVDTDKDIKVTGTHLINLFSIPPEELYINWAAAMQIQFHPAQVSQDFSQSETKIEWARMYLEMYCASVNKRIVTMKDKFLDPFINY